MQTQKQVVLGNQLVLIKIVLDVLLQTQMDLGKQLLLIQMVLGQLLQTLMVLGDHCCIEVTRYSNAAAPPGPIMISTSLRGPVMHVRTCLYCATTFHFNAL